MLINYELIYTGEIYLTSYQSFKAGTVFNEIPYRIDESKIDLVRDSITLKFPTRLNTMLLDFTKLAANKEKIYPAGEVLISVGQTVKISTKYLGGCNGKLKIGNKSKRKALVNHAYLLMCHALGKSLDLFIDVDASSVTKHCGLGSSGAIIAGVCCSINELYGNPIQDIDLLRYIASNYGEEVTNDDKDNVQNVASIGGSISTGLFTGGVQVVCGNAIPIMRSDYHGRIILGIPNDYKPLTALEQLTLEEEHVYNNPRLEDENPIVSLSYNKNLAYNMLNYALPLLKSGDISAVSDLSFDFNFISGGIKIYDYLFPRVNEIADNVRYLYEQKKCAALGKSSIGPAFYAVVNNKHDEEICAKEFRNQNMNVSIVPVHNGKYEVVDNES